MHTVVPMSFQRRLSQINSRSDRSVVFMHQFTLQTPKVFVGRSQGRSRFLLLLRCVSVLCRCENEMIIEPDVYRDLQMEIKCNKEYRTEHTKALCKKKKNLALSCQIRTML